MIKNALTAAQEDYVEVLFRHGKNGLRVTDLADYLGCRLPTVSRTVATLVDLDICLKKDRGSIFLTQTGKKLGEQIAHRHDDIVFFLNKVLGVNDTQANDDACRIEHGLSALSAQRLHAFLESYESLPQRIRDQLRHDIELGANDNSFSSINSQEVRGWRS